MVDITKLDTDVSESLTEEVQDDAETLLFKTDEPVEIQIGDSVGNPIVTRAEYFAVISIDTEVPMNPMQAAMEGVEDPEDATVEVDETTVHVANEDAEIGGGVFTIEGGTVDEAVEQFSDEHL